MKLIDKDTKFVVAEITTNHSMTIDEAIKLSGYVLDTTDNNPEGQLQDEDGNYINAYYDNLDFVDDDNGNDEYLEAEANILADICEYTLNHRNDDLFDDDEIDKDDQLNYVKNIFTFSEDELNIKDLK